MSQIELELCARPGRQPAAGIRLEWRRPIATLFMTHRASHGLSETDRKRLLELDAKINAILPPRYVGCFEDVSPQSMGSARLKYDPDGKVSWGQIWTTFCHLALAGGPPNRGRLLDPVPVADVRSHPTEQQAVVAEIERAIRLSTELPTTEDKAPGWVGVRCHDEDMAAWLVRAIVAENVSARHEGKVLYVPAGPQFRVEKEIKSVVVSLAKTCHYLLDHVEPDARPRGFDRPLIQPAFPDQIAESPASYQSAAEEINRGIRRQTGLETALGVSPGWIGVKCSGEEMAVWLLRAVAVEDVLVRRKGDVLCLPVSVHRNRQYGTDRVVSIVAQSHELWRAHVALAGTVRE